MSRAPGKYVAGTMAPAGAALDRPDLDNRNSIRIFPSTIVIVVTTTTTVIIIIIIIIITIYL
jgi:hypothetical protein